MDTMLIMSYLAELNQHNERQWYHDHKTDYEAAKNQFETLLAHLIREINQFDNSIIECDPRELTFKLVRDTRFSHDKSPYNPAFRAHIGAKGKQPVPVGYYIMLKPHNQSFLGGGLFADMFKDATTMIRDYIVKNSSEWEHIIHEKEFQQYFQVQGNALKNVPKGYNAQHPQAEYLKFKSWYLEYPISDETLQNTEIFFEQAIKVFKLMKPFNDFLNRALVEFEMPKR